MNKRKNIDADNQFWDRFDSEITCACSNTSDKYYGHYLPGDRFYFGRKNEPYIRNSFKTVIYGRVYGDRVEYSYGKDPVTWAIVAVMFVMMIIFLIKGHFPFASSITFLGIAVLLFSVPMSICLTREKKALYQQLYKLCKGEVEEIPFTLKN